MVFLPSKRATTAAHLVTLVRLVLLSPNYGHRRLDSLALRVPVTPSQAQTRIADGVTNVCFPSGLPLIKYYLASVAPLG